MMYQSTRGSEKKKNAAQAIIAGIAEDKGLYVPEQLPTLPATLSELQKLSYPALAQRILAQFLTDYTEEELQNCAVSAYDAKFEAPEIVPLVKGNDAWFLELYHGKTAAFKDMALSILPYLLTTALKKEKEEKKIAILTATSGDTGKAALEGFANVPNTEIIVFFPFGAVSQVQEKQMTTQEGANTHVYAIKGNFDDAQTAVKTIFNDPSLAEQLDARGYKFSSANSINIGRLVPQVAYYVWAYLQMVTSGAISMGDPMNVVVPTGNFGNILAAYYAGKMGVPIHKFICASNENKVLTDFINTGVYDIRREFVVTNSPSMDILISSNLERLLYHLSGNNGGEIATLMTSLEQEKRYEVSSTIKAGLADFYGGYATEEETKAAIGTMYREHGYLMDTHTAVAYRVYEDYQKATGDHTPAVIASTASAYKFAESVAESIGLPQEADGFASVKALYEETKVRIPVGLSGLEEKPVLHTGVLEKDGLAVAVLNALK